MIGDQFKQAEQRSETFIEPVYVIARIDGRRFSKFSKHFKKPYDRTLARLMRATSMQLAKNYSPDLVYFQSDEISLYWKHLDIFSRRTQKIASTLAASATAAFMYELSVIRPELLHRQPSFDARVHNVADINETYDYFLWRAIDARKNSIHSWSKQYMSQKALNCVPSRKMLELLTPEQQAGYHNAPAYFKLGTFLKREAVYKPIKNALDIPEKFRPPEGSLVLHHQYNAYSVDMQAMSRYKAILNILACTLR